MPNLAQVYIVYPEQPHLPVEGRHDRIQRPRKQTDVACRDARKF